jgi:hypothetical protein
MTEIWFIKSNVCENFIMAVVLMPYGMRIIEKPKAIALVFVDGQLAGLTESTRRRGWDCLAIAMHFVFDSNE